MRIVHITPTYFGNSSVIGGGERYVAELASHMAKEAETTLVSFSARRDSYSANGLKIELYPAKHFILGIRANPLSFRYLASIPSAGIVHIHQLNTLVSDMGCLLGRLIGKRTYVTDYGGGAGIVLNRMLPVMECYQAAFTYSGFGLSRLPEKLRKKAVLIRGGVDTDKFSPDPKLPREKKIIFVGRILPHKGINYLVEGFRLLNRSDFKLTILGRVYDERFYQRLKELALGLRVEFVQGADDTRLIQEYRTAYATVLPSVHTDCYGNYTPVPELMGFSVLESQACGTPVICSDAGAMKEFVEEGRTGLIAKQNSPEAIADALRRLLELSAGEYREWEVRCRKFVEPLSWSSVVRQHLDLYTSSE